MTTGIQSKTAAASNYADASTAKIVDKSSTDALANKQTFLQLLVAQIKNQDPLNPADGTQFLTQLAQFSELEQLISIRQTVGNLANPNGNTDQAGTGTGSGNKPDAGANAGTGAAANGKGA